MVQRLTYRRRHCYATKSNKTRKVKTPGVRLHHYQGMLGREKCLQVA